jgi:hypothetical protein
MSQVVELLPSKCKAMSLNPRATKKKKDRKKENNYFLFKAE